MLALNNDLELRLVPIFTDNTREKVNKFQNEYSLAVGGIVGIDTKAALYDFF